MSRGLSFFLAGVEAVRVGEQPNSLEVHANATNQTTTCSFGIGNPNRASIEQQQSRSGYCESRLGAQRIRFVRGWDTT